ncbi:hypothetical protein FSP39_001295 [Pinctada imbricata]|uniref:Reverse transcriptase domain-containing protein n=1 Tax=Pinctada imbricata TaxID=66713 RepID=A0AA88Y2F8_PINIB|nr:hypothetical protein FSP39_001295 [Pinctada imbricata]
MAEFLEDGFKNGFSLQYTGPRFHYFSKNLKSAEQAQDIVLQKINKEIHAGRVAGPFGYLPISNLRISPLGLVPKKGGDFRLIHHLSYPKHGSVNDFTPDEYCTVHYASIDDAVDLIRKLGQKALLAKSDIKSAFRLLPVWPGDFELLGFSFKEQFYFDKCLPFGSSISCSLFEKFSTFIHWAVDRSMSLPSSQIIHYLDDFLFCAKHGTTQCHELMRKFNEICQELGVPIAEDKTEGPTTRLTFLGIEFDTINMTMKLPAEKLREITEKIQSMLLKKKTTLNDLQSLIGSLNFACRVVNPGRAFLRRLIDATISVHKAHHRIRVSESMKDDLKAWLEFFTNYHGITVMPDQLWISTEQLEFFTDSSGGKYRGFSIYFQGHWAYATWPSSWVDSGLMRNITFLELLPVVTAVIIWGQYLENKKVVFHIDNLSVVQIINKKSSKDPCIMRLIRKLVICTLHRNILIRAEHIPGIFNDIADAISRCQWDKFRRLAPQADPRPTPVPQEIWTI